MLALQTQEASSDDSCRQRSTAPARLLPPPVSHGASSSITQGAVSPGAHSRLTTWNCHFGGQNGQLSAASYVQPNKGVATSFAITFFSPDVAVYDKILPSSIHRCPVSRDDTAASAHTPAQLGPQSSQSPKLAATIPSLPPGHHAAPTSRVRSDPPHPTPSPPSLSTPLTKRKQS